VRVHSALLETMRSRLVQESFRLTGQHPFNIGQVFSNCTTKLTSEEGLAVSENMKKWSQIMSLEGEIADTVFESCKIPALVEGTSKDSLVLNRRRSCLLTNPRLIQREIAKREEKEALAAQQEQNRIDRALRVAQSKSDRVQNQVVKVAKAAEVRERKEAAAVKKQHILEARVAKQQLKARSDIEKSNKRARRNV